MEYTTRGTCSTKIHFSLQDNRVYSVQFENGCNGNLKAIAKLIEGLDADDVIRKLRGIDCKDRGTSCADQLARALENAME